MSSKQPPLAKSATVFCFKPRDPDGPETTVPRLPKSQVPLINAPEQKPVELPGKLRAWFVIGRGGVGKTTLVRYAAERVDAAGGHQVVAAVDPANRSLTLYRPDVVEPPSNDPAETATWLQELLLHCMREQMSALIDLGGGDTSLHRLLLTVPDLADVLHAGGLEPVALHVTDADPHSLAPLAETEEAGFRPAATAIVCNERLDPRDRFGPVLRHSLFRAALDRGAIPLWMPYLTRDVARMLDARHLPFGEAGDLGPFNGAAVRLWLRAMETEFEPIRKAGWFPQ